MTLPDDLTRSLQRAIVEDQSAAPDLFEKAAADVLNLMTDNIYPAYIKGKAAEGAAPAPAALAVLKAGGGGGCCVIA